MRLRDPSSPRMRMPALGKRCLRASKDVAHVRAEGVLRHALARRRPVGAQAAPIPAQIAAFVKAEVLKAMREVQRGWAARVPAVSGCCAVWGLTRDYLAEAISRYEGGGAAAAAGAPHGVSGGGAARSVNAGGGAGGMLLGVGLPSILPSSALMPAGLSVVGSGAGEAAMVGRELYVSAGEQGERGAGQGRQRQPSQEQLLQLQLRAQEQVAALSYAG